MTVFALIGTVVRWMPDHIRHDGMMAYTRRVWPMAVITHRVEVDDLAAFIRAHSKG